MDAGHRAASSGRRHLSHAPGGRATPQPVAEVYKKVSVPIFEEYTYIYDAFRDVAEGETSLDKLGIDKVISAELNEIILDKFKPEKIFIQGKLELKTYDYSGVDKIKKALQAIEKVSETVSVNYLGGGRYKIIIEDFDYKPAEKNLKKVQDIIDKFNDKLSEAKFEREKKD